MSNQTNRDDDAFIVYQKDRHGLSLNAELKGSSLVSSFITPTSGIFHRNHDDYLLVPRGVKAVEDDWSVVLSVDEELVQQNPDHWRSWAKNAPSSNTIQLTYKHILRSTGKCCGLESAEVLACMECAGNRRSEISKSGDEKAEGIQWNSGAISNAVWKGPLLRSLLILQGIPDPYSHYDHFTLEALVPSKEAIENDCALWAQHLHVHLQSAQSTSESDKPSGEFFGASIPLSVALHPTQQSLIATHLNGCILPQQHGYPLRIVLPGHVGARWVKWLSALRISPNANDSPPMRLDYKIIERPKNVSKGEEKQWKSRMSGQEMDTEFRKEVLSHVAPIQALGVGSSIEVPTEGATFPLNTKTIKVKGYATGQYGSPVSTYEVIVLRQNEISESHDSLRRRAVAQPKADWIPASVRSEINNDVNGRERQIVFSYAWSLWEIELPISLDFKEGYFAILGRATTASGILQELETPWNLRGVCIRSWSVVSGLKLE